MNSHSRHRNPFYLLIVVVGVAFALTACGFVVLMVRELEPSRSRPGDSGALIHLLNRHGVLIMTWELAILAITTVVAITTDGYWNRCSKHTSDSPNLDHKDQTQ